MIRESGVPPTDSIRRRQINAHRPSPKAACSRFFLVGVSVFHGDAAEEVREKGTCSCPPGRHPKTHEKVLHLSFYFFIFNSLFLIYFSITTYHPYTLFHLHTPLHPHHKKIFSAAPSWLRLNYLASSVHRRYQLLRHVIHLIRVSGRKTSSENCTCSSSDTALFQKCEDETNDLPVELRICIVVTCLRMA